MALALYLYNTPLWAYAAFWENSSLRIYILLYRIRLHFIIENLHFRVIHILDYYYYVGVKSVK